MKTFCVLTGVVWLVALLLVHLLGLSPNSIDLSAVLQASSMQHWFGTDELGRDVFARVCHGLQVSVCVSVIVTVVTVSIGLLCGLLAGYYGGWADHLLMQVTDVVLAFPGLLLAIALAAVLGPGLPNLILALCLTGWVSVARLTRTQALSLRQRAHVLAAQSLGASDGRIIAQHILPLLRSIVLVEATYSMASVMIAEAALSFLGIGVQAPEASWGGMLRDAVRFMLVSPHYVLSIGASMMSLILAINLGGDWMRDQWDVRSEGQL